MAKYSPPVTDMKFVLGEVLNIGAALPAHPDLGEYDGNNIEALLEHPAKWVSDVLVPLNRSGDEEGAVLHPDGSVTTPKGFPQAYKQYTEMGLGSAPFPAEFGGQELPWSITSAYNEMVQAGNMAFGLSPLLGQGAIDALLHHGTDEQQQKYLEKLVTGEWTGTMNLTEPQAGSDLALLKSKAEPQEDGSYLISGEKIFITYGADDFADNKIHLVLARTPDAPEGVKGISLFLVPQVLGDGTQNDAKCIKLEEKMGIHGSPTCTMKYGEDGGARGYLIGQEGQGLKCMFTMMNNARLAVGVQGLALSEAAYQESLDYAQNRPQGASSVNKGETAMIVEHEDVQRMLKKQKALADAGRALAYEAMHAIDLKNAGKDTQWKVDLLTPIVKAWCTDNAVNSTSEAIQVAGGWGYIKEVGLEQFARDAKITALYEGTNGIQALDLAGRKTAKADGELSKKYISELEAIAADNAPLKEALTDLFNATNEIVDYAQNNAAHHQAAAKYYLNAFGIIAGAGAMERRKQAAERLLESKDGQYDPQFLENQIALAEFYFDEILPEAQAEMQKITNIGKGSKAYNFDLVS